MKPNRSVWLIGLLYGLVLTPAILLSAEAKRSAGDQLAAELGKLTGHDFRAHQAGIVELVTDAPDQTAGKCVLHLSQALPRMRAASRFPADAPAPTKALVALFSKRDEFLRFLRARKAPLEESYTLVDDAEAPIIAAFVLDERPMLARLRHVGMELMLKAWFPHPPPWLTEGMGEVVEDLKWDEKGDVVLEPGRGHQRDLREKVLEARPPQQIPLLQLVKLDRAAWNRAGLPAYAQSWAFVRFLLEDQGAREARMLQKVLSRLNPRGDEVDNLRRAQAAFQDDEWNTLETTWLEFVKKMPETSAEEPYRQARAKIEKSDFAGAWRLLDEALKLDPFYERLYYFRAVTASAAEDFTGAVKDLDKALSLFPEYHAARFLRGRCKLALKDAAGARADFEACLETDYRDQAKKALGKL
jgi:hypothetical protein